MSSAAIARNEVSLAAHFLDDGRQIRRESFWVGPHGRTSNIAAFAGAPQRRRPVKIASFTLGAFAAAMAV